MRPLLSFAAAIALPLAFTSTILVSVASNRSGTREEIVLTEQEVSIEGGEDADSGARLWVSWSDAAADARWSSCETLHRLGLHCADDHDSPGREAAAARQLPRYAFVALALEGTRATRSRLVPIDADRDADALRRRHPDATKDLIVSAVVAAVRRVPADGTADTSAMLVTLDPRGIQVPTELRRYVPARAPGGTTPPIRVTVRYGRRWEPWIVGIR